MGFATNHVHVWQSLLEQAGFTLDDIPKDGRRFGRSGAIRSSRRCARPRAATTSRASGCHVGRRGRHQNRVPPVHAGLRGQLRDAATAGWSSTTPRSGQADQGHGRLHRDLSQGLHPARAWTGTNRGNNQAFLAQTVVMTPNPTLSIPNALQARAARRLLQEHGDDRMAGWCRRPAARDRPAPSRRGLQGWRATRPGQGVRALSRRARAGSPTISTSPATACCRRCRSCSTRRSGSTRATRTAWLGDAVPDPPTRLQLCGVSGDRGDI